MKDLTFDIEIEFEDYEKGIPLLVKIFGIYFYENSPEHVKRIDYDHYEVFIPIDTHSGHKDVSVPLEVAELLFGGLIDEKVGFKLHEILQNNLIELLPGVLCDVYDFVINKITHDKDTDLMLKYIDEIERATGKSIEEVLK